MNCQITVVKGVHDLSRRVLRSVLRAPHGTVKYVVFFFLCESGYGEIPVPTRVLVYRMYVGMNVWRACTITRFCFPLPAHW